jgi:hypothetical protein
MGLDSTMPADPFLGLQCAPGVRTIEPCGETSDGIFCLVDAMELTLLGVQGRRAGANCSALRTRILSLFFVRQAAL